MRASQAVFAVLVLLALIGFGGLRSWRSPAPAPLAFGTAPARIEVRRPREDLILTRDAGGPWVIARQEDLADAEAVELLLNGLRSLTFGPPVAPPAAGVSS